MDTNGKIQLFPLLRIAVVLCAGIIMGDGVGDRVPLWLWLSILGLLLFPLCFTRFKPVIETCLIFFAVFVLGIWITVLKEGRLRVVLPEKEVEYEAIVTSQPVVRGKVIRFDMLITRCANSRCEQPLRVKAALLRDTVEGRYRQISIGDALMARSVLTHPTQFYPQSHFDYGRWLQVHGFIAETFIYYTQWREILPDCSVLSGWERIRLSALRLRQQLTDRYVVGGIDGEARVVVAAMTLGDKSELSRDIKEAYSIAGGSHILALSGLHLGIIYAFLTLLFPRRRWRMITQGFVLSSIWGYVILVGMSPSVVRAAVMISIYVVASLLGRNRMSVNALSLAAIVMLISNPLDLWDVGFQLSFAAVLAIFILFRPIYNILPDRFPSSLHIVKVLWSMVAVSVAAQVGTAPLVAFYFGRFSCYFLLTNFLVIPAAMIILYSSFAMFALAPFVTIQKYLANFILLVAECLNGGVFHIAALPGAAIEGIDINQWQLILIYLLIVCVYIAVHYVRKIYRRSLI